MAKPRMTVEQIAAMTQDAVMTMAPLEREDWVKMALDIRRAGGVLPPLGQIHQLLYAVRVAQERGDKYAAAINEFHMGTSLLCFAVMARVLPPESE